MKPTQSQLHIHSHEHTLVEGTESTLRAPTVPPTWLMDFIRARAPTGAKALLHLKGFLSLFFQKNHTFGGLNVLRES